MTKPLLYDVYCKAGGATRGYQLAGFEVVGIDIEPQPRHCGDRFIQMDAFEFFQRVAAGKYPLPDAWHCSPPCQWVTHAAIQWRSQGRQYPDLVTPTRDILLEMGQPYVIEQPVGQVLRDPVMLNGAMFGLRVKRDRFFETNWPMLFQLLPQSERPAHFGRPFDARKGELFYPVGHFSGVAEGRAAMGIDWPMTGKEVAAAIPPAYTRYVGQQLLRHLGA